MKLGVNGFLEVTVEGSDNLDLSDFDLGAGRFGGRGAGTPPPRTGLKSTEFVAPLLGESRVLCRA